MEQSRDSYDLGSRSIQDSIIPDDAELLGGRTSPGLSVSTSTNEPPLSYRRHSRGYSGDGRLKSVSESGSIQGDEFEIVEPPSPLKVKRLPSESTTASVLRRLTTKIRPLGRGTFKSTKRSRGRQYATLDDETADQAATVDISSLEGMGWEMTDLSTPGIRVTESDDTAYVSPAATQKPGFREFVGKRTSVGYGMNNIRVQLRRDPTRLLRRSTAEARVGTSSAIERSKTVKEVGQNLAHEKNTIVEVDEVVDLSSLEGGQSDNRASQMFESTSRQSTLPKETKSYFFPDDPDIPNWKPLSMRPWYILSLMVLALGLAGFQEFLCHKSAQKARENSGILEFNAVSEISTWDFFAWKCKSILNHL
jgi:hypothetical protein